MSKGSKRRKENKALVNKNWDAVFTNGGRNSSRLGEAWAKLLKTLLGIK